MKLSIIVPAYNEEDRIGRMLDEYLPYFESLYGCEVEFIIVVNGSIDGTERVVSGYASGHPCVVTLIEPRNIGKGGALMKGFGNARGDLVGYVDADGSTPPIAFQDLVDHIGDAGVVMASRWVPGADVDPPQPLKRRIASRVFNLITRCMFGLKVTDTQCGAKVMKKSAVLSVLADLGTTHWAFDVDLLYQFKRRGWSIAEIPTTWRHVGGSQLRVARASLNMLIALIRLRLVYSPFKFVVHFYHNFIGRHIDEYLLKRAG